MYTDNDPTLSDNGATRTANNPTLSDNGATHTAYVHEHKDLGPGTVDRIGRAQPHECHEGEEVAMVEMPHAIKHPCWWLIEGREGEREGERGWVKEK